MQRQMEEQLAQERQTRIEHTMQMAIRRIGKRDLSLGWVAWYDAYVARTRVRRMLSNAAARLVKPKLVSAVKHWRKEWEVSCLNAQVEEVAAKLEAARASEIAAKAEMHRQLEEQMSAADAASAEAARRLEAARRAACRRAWCR